MDNTEQLNKLIEVEIIAEADEQGNTQESQQETMMRGTIWFAVADVISRGLGAVYIIPWYMLMGQYANEANGMFSIGYNIYALFLLISTAGIPIAIAREVAKYNAMGDESLSHRLVRQMFIFMVGLGIVSAVAMYFLSPAFAHMSAKADTAPDLIPVLRSLALSILIFPGMAVIRGYFQGLNEIKPIALSQIYEQIIRVIWMLVLTFMIMKIGLSGGDWRHAVVQSTTAAFIGMLASCVVLVWSLVKNDLLMDLVSPKPSKNQIHTVQLVKNTLWQSIPFVVISSAIQIFKLVDQFTFATVMSWVTDLTGPQLTSLFADFSANTDKLTMIVIGEAGNLGAVALPLITANYIKKNYRETARLISYDFQLLAAFMLPAIAGMVVLAEPIYRIFYLAPTTQQLSLFIWTLIQAILLGLYIMVAPILQSLRYSRVAMKYFFIALSSKVILQIPLIMIFKAYGPLIATTLAILFGDFLMIRKLHKVTRFSKKSVTRGITGIAILTVLMVVLTGLALLLSSLLLSWMSAGKLKSFIIVLISGGVGFYAYLWLAANLGLLEKLMGERGKRLKTKLRL